MDKELDKYLEHLEKLKPRGFEIGSIGTIEIRMDNGTVKYNTPFFDWLNHRPWKQVYIPISLTYPKKRKHLNHICALLVDLTHGVVHYYDTHYVKTLERPAQLLVIQSQILPYLQQILTLTNRLCMNVTKLDGQYRFTKFF